MLYSRSLLAVLKMKKMLVKEVQDEREIWEGSTFQPEDGLGQAGQVAWQMLWVPTDGLSLL